MAVAVHIPELAVVEFTHELHGYPAGAVGVVVSAYPEDDSYTVEVADGAGRTLDLVEARADDLRITHLI